LKEIKKKRRCSVLSFRPERSEVEKSGMQLHCPFRSNADFSASVEMTGGRPDFVGRRIGYMSLKSAPNTSAVKRQTSVSGSAKKRGVTRGR